MSKALFSLINPIVKLLLRSPFHGLMSHNTMILEFRGRKSGRTYTTPVTYHAVNGRLHCFSSKTNRWWRNLQHGEPVGLTLRGCRVVGTPTVSTESSTEMQKALYDLLIASPRDASHAGVAFDAAGRPVASDVAEAAERLVFISIEVPRTDPLAPGA